MVACFFADVAMSLCQVCALMFRHLSHPRRVFTFSAFVCLPCVLLRLAPPRKVVLVASSQFPENDAHCLPLLGQGRSFWLTLAVRLLLQRRLVHAAGHRRHQPGRAAPHAGWLFVSCLMCSLLSCVFAIVRAFELGLSVSLVLCPIAVGMSFAAASASHQPCVKLLRREMPSVFSALVV
jgi:hypothetical protein